MGRNVVAALVGVILLVACRSVPQPTGGASLAPKQMKVDGNTLAYVEDGSGVPVVFVHGALVDLREWEPQRHAIAKHYRYIAYSLRYHWPNPSAGDVRDYSYELHASDLAAFIAGLGAGPVHIVGHSFGGTIAMLMALRHPNLVRSLILVEPGIASMIADEPDAKPILARRAEFLASFHSAAAAGDLERAEQILVDEVTGDAGHFARLPPSVREEMRANERTVGPLASVKPPALTCSHFASIQSPTLVVMGRRAIPYYVKVSEATARCLPHAKLAVLPTGAHTMTFEDPEPFNRLLEQFLSDQGG